MINNEFHTVRGYQLLENSRKHLTSAMEDYLEMIYRSSKDRDYLRIGELAQLLNVKAPSASKMVQRLSDLGLLKFKKYGIIILNESGKDIGEYLLTRHQLLEVFLKIIGCEEELLQQTELIEHDVNPVLLRNIQLLSNFFLDHDEIMDQYREYRNRQMKLNYTPTLDKEPVNG
jgi:Mn-dependent DtxR family transcriptional regulator